MTPGFRAETSPVSIEFGLLPACYCCRLRAPTRSTGAGELHLHVAELHLVAPRILALGARVAH